MTTLQALEKDANTHQLGREYTAKKNSLKVDSYKKIYSWLNKQDYSGVSVDTIIKIGDSFEKLNEDYNSDNVVNFKVPLDIIMKISGSDNKFVDIKKNFIQMMKDINAIKGKVNDVIRAEEINTKAGNDIIQSMNSLGLFGGNCSVKVLTYLIIAKKSNTTIR
ncbi:hypothetical protein GAMM_140001 [Gammaproteobacteria bacterium]